MTSERERTKSERASVPPSSMFTIYCFVDKRFDCITSHHIQGISTFLPIWGVFVFSDGHSSGGENKGKKKKLLSVCVST